MVVILPIEGKVYDPGVVARGKDVAYERGLHGRARLRLTLCCAIRAPWTRPVTALTFRFVLRAAVPGVGGVVAAGYVLPGAMSGFALMLPKWAAGVAFFRLLA